MSYKFEEGKDLIIEAVVDKLQRKMSGEQIKFCTAFVRQFYGTVALEDLREWDIDDLYGSVVNFWSLIQQRLPNQTKMRIYNPDYERHGWQTTHTVVEIVTDDMPFLVDSLRMVINRLGVVSHLIMHMGNLRVIRNEEGEICEVLDRNGAEKEQGVIAEAAILIEIDRQTDASVLENLHQNFERVLEDNRIVVADWMPMREKIRSAIKELENVSSVLEPNEATETIAFLNWIEDHHFTFLGMREYNLIQKGHETILQPQPETGLGILRESLSKSSARNISAMTPEARELTLSSRALVMSKTNTESTVHRRAHTDYIGVKRFNKKGQVIGELRIIGLYTSAAYNTSPKHIPFLRHKLALIMQTSNVSPSGHAGKVLLNILETLPRDDLIQAPEDELLEIAMGIYYMQERRRIRMFARTDLYRRFVSCLIYVPRDRYNTELRLAMEKILKENFHSQDIEFSTLFSESVLARIHFIVRTNPQDNTQWNFKEIEQKIIEVARTWTDDLQHFLFDTFGEENANRLYARYKNAFPVAYSANFTPRAAVYDINHVEALSTDTPLVMNFYKPMDEAIGNFRLKIYQHDNTLPLSEVLPIIERLGMKAISERPYVLKFDDGKVTWINDFALQYNHDGYFELDEIKDLFQNAFASIWAGLAENDGFNQLVLASGLDWRQVSVLRTYAKYFKQIGFTFSQEYIETALTNNPHIARRLVNLFEIRFDPNLKSKRVENFAELVEKIFLDLDEVANLDEDRIIRQYVQTISSTLRTNYYQRNKNNKLKDYISIKLSSKDIPGVPKPYPLYEIFVYSPRFEAVHLRHGKVARGGLRWSDRREDFRTEVLGLMKAQQVKNAVIVPSGAKGGFVPKHLPLNGSREDIQEEGISCYKLFIRGLLDITDNYIDGSLIKPDNLICYDEDDPYLVVAADKGTATFSDIANAISQEYNFWLGDAFASGGSVGYDHKKMGITAKGAWESVKRHFYEMGRDSQIEDFTVIGIGDMSGDVFGNGMLLSRHIKLLGAFNHQHIFIDPNPDPEVSFLERERLFNLPRSLWSDYDKKLISKGGGIFNRNAKSITLSKEMKEVFGIKAMAIEPNQLIRILLKAKVDLLWSAGIGTFVKAQSESHLNVGDRTNDAIRVDGRQLRCKVVGEGGNLGLTQLSRIEYAINGGLIYTDFIDNSAGVNCSDKEVNIKILLNGIVRSGDLTEKQRNVLLGEMTDEVSKLVLRDNFVQPRAISLAASQATRLIDLHARYISNLEHSGKLNRNLEFLPDEKTLTERKLVGGGLTRPSLAILLCYSKTILKAQILESNVPEDPYFKALLKSSFPTPLAERYSNEMENHPLKREIIATKISNIIVNEMGFTFVYRQQDETGAPVSAIVCAYMIARSVLNLENIWKEIDNLGTTITADKQIELTMLYLRLLRRVTRWFLRNQRMRLDISKAVKLYAPGVLELKKAVPEILGKVGQIQYNNHYNQYLELKIPPSLAHELALTRPLFSAMDIIEVAGQVDVSVEKVAEVYFGLGDLLDLPWIRSQVISHSTDNHWESLSREALRDDLDWQQRQLTAGIINFDNDKKDFMYCFEAWSMKHQALIERWQHVLSDLRASSTLNYTMFFVAIRELLDLTQTTIQMKEMA
ncbi:MAG: NAD-glutamate dehydrogenase [Tatlockia sp.]|nr:NAD-glutamate dehydrogenase [Tatlockia sp.]